MNKQLGSRAHSNGASALRLNDQAGAMLLEALVAILIFSVGILALFGIQAAAMKHVGEAQYRATASYLANDLIGVLWANGGAQGVNMPSFNCNGCTSSTQPAMQSWLQRVSANLPNALAPIVQIRSDPFAATTPALTCAVGGAPATRCNEVNITLRWRTRDKNGGPLMTHSYTLLAYVNFNS
jgi:type IV pilus assembly protein PilV